MNGDGSVEADHKDVTEMLRSWGEGDSRAAERLTEFVYAQVRAMARRNLRQASGRISLQPTELAHELFVKLLDAGIAWRDRRHFYGVVSAALRNLLIDTARARASEKRGGDALHVTLSAAEDVAEEIRDPTALDDALRELRALDERKHEIIELHYLLGFKREEIAEIVGVSVPTVDRDLRFAKTWLHDRLRT